MSDPFTPLQSVVTVFNASKDGAKGSFRVVVVVLNRLMKVKGIRNSIHQTRLTAVITSRAASCTPLHCRTAWSADSKTKRLIVCYLLCWVLYVVRCVVICYVLCVVGDLLCCVLYAMMCLWFFWCGYWGGRVAFLMHVEVYTPCHCRSIQIRIRIRIQIRIGTRKRTIGTNAVSVPSLSWCDRWAHGIPQHCNKLNILPQLFP